MRFKLFSKLIFHPQVAFDSGGPGSRPVSSSLYFCHQAKGPRNVKELRKTDLGENMSLHGLDANLQLGLSWTRHAHCILRKAPQRFEPQFWALLTRLPGKWITYSVVHNSKQLKWLEIQVQVNFIPVSAQIPPQDTRGRTNVTDSYVQFWDYPPASVIRDHQAVLTLIPPFYLSADSENSSERSFKALTTCSAQAVRLCVGPCSVQISGWGMLEMTSTSCSRWMALSSISPWNLKRSHFAPCPFLENNDTNKLS